MLTAEQVDRFSQAAAAGGALRVQLAAGDQHLDTDVTGALVIMVRIKGGSVGECMGVMPAPEGDERVAHALGIVALAHLDACGILDAAIEAYGQIRELRELDGEPVKH